jgi:tRNA A-37 threonylcarbamoyl transferase component Bud32
MTDAVDARPLDEDAVSLTAALVHLGLADSGEDVDLVPLTGGVSSDIRLARTARGPVVLKRALERLRVAADWRAPQTRVASEAAWLEYAGSVVPGSCPRVLAFDPDTYTMVLEYIDPASHGNWKADLLAGRVDPGFAASVGDDLGRIHSASAADPGLAARFDNAELFESLRIEPYLVRTARAVPEARTALEEIAADLRATRVALVHGDVSPKNVLTGERPLLLDAECATWSDPAFDAAFCLTHLVLKRIHLPAHAAAFAEAADAFRGAYLARVDWEDADAVAARIDRIVPALLLARVAGASPVEYLDVPERRRVRALAVDAVNGRRTLAEGLGE